MKVYIYGFFCFFLSSWYIFFLLFLICIYFLTFIYLYFQFNELLPDGACSSRPDSFGSAVSASFDWSCGWLFDKGSRLVHNILPIFNNLHKYRTFWLRVADSYAGCRTIHCHLSSTAGKIEFLSLLPRLFLHYPLLFPLHFFPSFSLYPFPLFLPLSI